MDIPADIKIHTTLEQGFTYYFPEESFKSAEPHYFVILNKNPNKDNYIIFVNATSRIEKTKRIQKLHKLPVESFVKVRARECSCLKKDSIFNCNSVLKKSTQSLVDKLNDNNLKFKGKMPEMILQKLIDGVRKSPLVEGSMKGVL